MSLIIQAAQFAAACHRDQKRDYNGRPFITHPIRVAGRVATNNVATAALVAATFLHDVVEDCDIKLDRIEVEFGFTVARYVDWLTNKSKDSDAARSERKRADRQRLTTAPREIQVVKLIDRCDNLQELLTDKIVDAFIPDYCVESRLLADALLSADPALAGEIYSLCTELEQLQQSTP